MNRNLVAVLAFCLSSLASNGQGKKLHSVYSNFQGKGNISFMNPLDLGVTLNTKKEWNKFSIGLSGYYPNDRSYTNDNDRSYNYYYYQELFSFNDTVTYKLQGLTNQGFGISVGFLTDFKLFKKLNLVSGVTLSNIINFKQSYYRISRIHITDSSWYSENAINEETLNVSYIPVFRTYFGAVFNMGEHLQLIPRINSNISVYKWSTLLNSLSDDINVRLTLRPSIVLGYKF